MTAAHADDDLTFVRTELGSHLDALLVFNLLRTHSYLGPVLDSGLRRRRLTAAQFNTLLLLRSAGPEGLRMGKLGERLVVTKSNVTGLVGRLARQRLVSRRRPRDRRATAVCLTGAGEKILARALPRHAKLFTELTGCLAGREKRTLIRLLTKLRRELRRRRKGAA